MTLFSFSNPCQVHMLKNGLKTQDTRPLNRCNVKVGDTIKCYYAHNLKKHTCANCIHIDVCESGYSDKCENWSNYFGEIVVTDIYKFNTEQKSLELWALCEGFLSFEMANKWFTTKYGRNWKTKDLYVIQFLPQWLNYCKDCKHWERFDDSCGICNYKDTYTIKFEHEYCDFFESIKE